MTHLALAAGSALPEIRLELDMGGVLNPVWVTAAQIEGESVVLYLRPEKPAYGDRRAAPRRADAKAPSRHRLRIHTLGRLRVEVDGRDVGGDWLRQRPGQLLAYLVCERNHVAASEQISEALWPKVPPWSTNSVRHQVHALRERLDPQRSSAAPPRFVITRRGGYMLDPEGTWIDADELEDAARSGLSLFVQGQAELARGPLEHAVQLYQGDLLNEDPYAEWAVEERGRLRELAESAIRALINVRGSADNLAGAADCARRLADMEPFDMDVQREYLAICIRRGRRSEAMRRYALVRRRLRRELGHDPDFTLADLGA